MITPLLSSQMGQLPFHASSGSRCSGKAQSWEGGVGCCHLRSLQTRQWEGRRRYTLQLCAGEGRDKLPIHVTSASCLHPCAMHSCSLMLACSSPYTQLGVPFMLLLLFLVAAVSWLNPALPIAAVCHQTHPLASLSVVFLLPFLTCDSQPPSSPMSLSRRVKPDKL